MPAVYASLETVKGDQTTAFGAQDAIQRIQAIYGAQDYLVFTAGDNTNLTTMAGAAFDSAIFNNLIAMVAAFGSVGLNLYWAGDDTI